MKTVRLSGQPMAHQQLMLPESVMRDEVASMRDQALRERDRYRRIRNRSGGYDGADRGRRQISEWNQYRGDADSALLSDLPTLRDYSRELERNHPIAAGISNTKVTNVVGTGLIMTPEIDRDVIDLTDDQTDAIEQRIAAEWSLFTTHECDIERASNFDELCAVAYRSVHRDGDAFALLPSVERPGSPYSTRVQLLEGDRISNPYWSADTASISGGVQRNPVNGELQGYHISDTHPHDVARRGLTKWDYFPAFGERTGIRMALHLMKKTRIGQSRGEPSLAPVIEPLRMLSKLTEAELMASVISSMFTVFVKTELGDDTLGSFEPTAESGGSSSDESYKMAAGAIVGLAEGESIESANPNRPNVAFEPFVLAILRQIGMAVEIPFEVLLKSFNSSYSASRAAMLEAYRFFVSERQWLCQDFCQPIYDRFFFEAVARGRIAAPGFELGDPLVMRAYTRARWIGPPRGMIDENKEVQAATARAAAFTTYEEETASLVGGSWRRKLKQRAKERDLMRELGMTPPDEDDVHDATRGGT